MRKARHGNKKSNRSALIIILFLLVIGGGLFGIYRYEQAEAQKAATAPEDDGYPERVTVYYDGAWYQLRDDLETYLILGIDKTEETRQDAADTVFNNQQCDFLMLMVVDRTNRSYCGIHLNRDTMCEIRRLGLGGVSTGTVTEQLALSHTYGSGGRDSCRNSAQAVSRLLYDVPVEHYFAVTMDAIPVLNDLVGGVTVHIEEDMSNVDPAFVEGADVSLDGQQALRFVRARMSVGDGSNLSRMNRQRVYITGLYEQMNHSLSSSDSFALRLANSMSDYMTSDLITEELAQLADQLKDYRFDGILVTEGEARPGVRFTEFYPDEAALQQLVVSVFFEPQT
ncbi:MAG: LCP family protein [Oscillospiraceae bacterium]|nr:LCP family protein [Oscillospiraceae bacterium]